MSRRGIAFVVSLMAAVAAPACREHGRPDPNIRMAISHEPEPGPNATQGASGPDAQGEVGSGQAPSVPTRLDVPEAVKQAYSGVVLDWKDSSSGKEGKLDVPFGRAVDLPGSGLAVSVDVFLPAFTMTNDAITSSGIEQENPAARIRVAEGGKEIFAGWVFKRFPDVHPFTHPRFSLRLDGGIRAPAK